MAKDKKKQKQTEEARPEEEQSKEEQPEERKSEGLEDYRLKNEKNWFSFFCKLIFFVTAFFLVIFTIMANMGGSSDMLKEGIESFAGKALGNRPAKIRKLHNMSFFPSFSVSFEDLRVMPYPESRDEVLSIGKLHAKMGFFDMMMSSAKFKAFLIEDLKIKKGFFTQRDILARKIYIDHDIGKSEAFLKGEGTMGPYNWDMALGVDISGYGDAYKFKLDGDTALSLHVADLTIEGEMKSQHNKFALLDNLVMSSRDLTLAGQIIFSAVSQGIVNMRGGLKAEDSSAVINFDMTLDLFKNPKFISGKVKLSGFQDADFAGQNSVMALIERFVEIFVQDDIIEKSEESGKIDYILDRISSYDYDLGLEIEKAGYSPAYEGEGSVFVHVLKQKGHYYLSGVHGAMGQAQIKVPDMLFLNHADQGGYVALVTEGANSIDLAKLVEGGISGQILDQDKTDQQCSAYRLGQSEQGAWSAESLNLAADNPLSFPEEDYKFVSSILLGRGANDPCMAFIAKE